MTDFTNSSSCFIISSLTSPQARTFLQLPSALHSGLEGTYLETPSQPNKQQCSPPPQTRRDASQHRAASRNNLQLQKFLHGLHTSQHVHEFIDDQARRSSSAIISPIMMARIANICRPRKMKSLTLTSLPSKTMIRSRSRQKPFGRPEAKDKSDTCPHTPNPPESEQTPSYHLFH